MSRPDAPAFRIRSDLQLEVEGLHASVIADGRQLTVVTSEAGQLLAQARQTALPGAAPSIRRMAGHVGQLLDEAGLSVRVVGERGVLIEFGRGCESRVGRLLLGSSLARPGQPAAAMSAAVGYLRARSGGRVRYAPAGLAVALLVLGAGVRRRRSAHRGAP